MESTFGGTMVPLATIPRVMTACDRVSTWIETPALKFGHEIVWSINVKFWLTLTGVMVREPSLLKSFTDLTSVKESES